MMERFRVIVLCSIMLAGALHAQSQSVWVQLFVDGLSSEQDCRYLETAILEHEGIRSVRAESVHGNLLFFIDSSVVPAEENIIAWIEEAGFEAWCFRKGISGTDPIVRISREQCLAEMEKE